jgi:hypothetical protein
MVEQKEKDMFLFPNPCLRTAMTPCSTLFHRMQMLLKDNVSTEIVITALLLHHQRLYPLRVATSNTICTEKVYVRFQVGIPPTMKLLDVINMVHSNRLNVCNVRIPPSQ